MINYSTCKSEKHPSNNVKLVFLILQFLKGVFEEKKLSVFNHYLLIDAGNRN